MSGIAMMTVGPIHGRLKYLILVVGFLTFLAGAERGAIAQANLRITTTSLPSGVATSPYTFTMTGAGGRTPYSWSATGLPAVLSIDSASGRITGTPNAPGSFSVAVTITDDRANTATVTYPLTINPAPLSISTTSLPSGTINVTYSQPLAATGSATPYTWTMSSALPTGLTLSNSVIGGTP